jgi:type IV secretory pathway VirB4 component
MLMHMFTKRAVQEIAPWMTLVTPELVLNKDGSLLTVFEFEGIDADSPNPEEASAARDNLDHACRNFDHRVTAWWRMSHRRTRTRVEGEFASTADARLDAINQASIGSGKFFKNSHSLALAFTPETGLSRVFDKIGYHMTVGGKSLPIAL